MPSFAPTLVFSLLGAFAQSAFAAPMKSDALSCRSKLIIDTDLVAQNAIAATNQRYVTIFRGARLNTQRATIQLGIWRSN